MKIRWSLLNVRLGSFDVEDIVSVESHESSDHFGDVAVERRRSHRENVVAIGRLEPVDASMDGLKILVTDISLHGCDFRCDLPPSQSTAYRIALVLGPLSMTSRLRVARSVRRADGTFEIAAEFV